MKLLNLRSFSICAATLVTSFLIAQPATAASYFTTESLLVDAERGLIAPELRPFLTPQGPLNTVTGITGSRGPLGSLGAVGNHFWNPSQAIFNRLANWQSLSQWLSEHGGPLSPNGPLFLKSELGQIFLEFPQKFLGTLPGNYHYQELSRALQPGGILHIVGSAGLISPLSLFGPLGPNGATGFSVNNKGQFIDASGSVVTTYNYKTHEGDIWRVPLIEFYKLKNGSNQLHSPDAFFATQGSIQRDQALTVTFENQREQWVTIAAINEYDLDSFSVALRKPGSSQVIAESSQSQLTNFIVIKLPANSRWAVDVRLNSSMHTLSDKPVRLYVNGSTAK